MKLIARFHVILCCLLLVTSCQISDPLLSPKSVTMTASPVTITASQNLKLVATVVFEGAEGDPKNFSVQFLNGTQILDEGAVSNNGTVTKEIPVNKSMNGVLAIKAKVIYPVNPDALNIESQPVNITINIP